MDKKDKNLGTNKSGFESPKGYLDQLEQDLFAKIAKGTYILESNIETPFVAPEGYLESFELNLNQRILNDRFLLDSDFESPYLAPAGYLEEVEVSILENTIPSRVGISISFKRAIYRIAAALLIVGGFSLWFFNQDSPSTELALNEISNDEIISYLEEVELYNDDLYALVESEMVDQPVFDELNQDELLDLMDAELINEL